VTKQSEARARVLDLIERLGVGDAIPSERQLTTDFGVSRLTVRAALDELVREGYLVRRRGAGTFVSEPKIAQELTMTSFTDDMRQRGLVPGSRTLELGVVSAGARLGNIYASLGAHGVAIPAGTCPSVGIGGHALGGERLAAEHRPGRYDLARVEPRLFDRHVLGHEHPPGRPLRHHVTGEHRPQQPVREPASEAVVEQHRLRR